MGQRKEHDIAKCLVVQGNASEDVSVTRWPPKVSIPLQHIHAYVQQQIDLYYN